MVASPEWPGAMRVGEMLAFKYAGRCMMTGVTVFVELFMMWIFCMGMSPLFTSSNSISFLSTSTSPSL